MRGNTAGKGTGAAPFVGTFRPEGSLSSFISGADIGNWRLRVTDAGASSVGALRCWSLFLYPPTCASGGGACDPCLPVINGIITAADPTQTGRWLGNLIREQLRLAESLARDRRRQFALRRLQFHQTRPQRTRA